jgi:hypothetical protein
VRGAVRLLFEGSYVVAVGVLAAFATLDPNDIRPSLWVAALLLCLPALIVVLPALYLLAAAAWNATGADSGGMAWPVTTTYVLVLCIAALANVVLLRWLTARTRRRALATGQRNA